MNSDTAPQAPVSDYQKSKDVHNDSYGTPPPPSYDPFEFNNTDFELQ
jgi:hypothetical protein